MRTEVLSPMLGCASLVQELEEEASVEATVDASGSIKPAAKANSECQIGGLQELSVYGEMSMQAT